MEGGVEATAYPKTIVRDVKGCANATRLVAVVGCLVGAVGRDVEVLGLDIREGRELDVERLQVGTGNLLVELLGKHVDAERELLGGGPESDLSEDLVGERAGHDERGVTGGTAIERRVRHRRDSYVKMKTYPRLTRRPSARRMM